MARKKKTIRANRGAGSVRVKDTGKVEYRFTYTDEFGETKRKSFVADSVETCMDRAKVFLEEIELRRAGIELDARIPDIIRGEYSRRLQFNFVSEAGYLRAMETLKIIEDHNIAILPIRSITKPFIQSFLGSITHYANATIKKVYQQLKMAFSIAMDNGIIQTNLMTSREMICPISDKPDKIVKAYTLAEQKKVEEVANNHITPYGRVSYKHQVFVELYTGMRIGEINALKPEDLDFEKKIIHVRRTVARCEDKSLKIESKTKTEAGMRDIPMNSIAEEHLKAAIREMRPNPEGLIFYDHRNKKIISTSQTNLYFQRLCEKAEVPFYGQHALRHTFATRCAEAGVKPVVLKNWMGHTDIHITMDIYTDVYDDMNNKSIILLEKYVKSDGMDDNDGKNPDEDY